MTENAIPPGFESYEIFWRQLRVCKSSISGIIFFFNSKWYLVNFEKEYLFGYKNIVRQFIKIA